MASFYWPPESGSGGSGTVTSVGLADSTGTFNISGSPVTGSGTLTVASFKSQAQSAVLIGPSSGGAGAPSFRSLVASDVPTLNQNTTGTAANITANSNSTLTTLPDLSLPYSQVTGGPSTNALTALTGDGSASGPGSATLTFATVNSSPGTYAISSVTVNAKGLVTSAIAASTTGSGSVVLATSPTLSNPVVGTQSQFNGSTLAASTSYVDTAVANAVAGVNPAVAVQAATTSAANTSGLTYNNGVSGVGATFTGTTNTAIVIDGYTFTAIGQRLLVKNDTQSPSGAFNGIYYVTQIQTSLLPPILTRALDYDTPSDINNTGAIPVVNGTVNGTTSWVQTAQIVTVGTTPLVFIQFSVNPSSLLTNPMTTLGDIIYENATPVPARLAGNTTATVNFLAQTGNGSVSAAPAWTAFTAPTVQVFTSGSGTYTLPTSPRTPLYLKIRMVGGGGGGEGSGPSSRGVGGTGGNTTFGTSLLAANGGLGGGSVNAGLGGLGGTTSLGGASGFSLSGGAGPCGFTVNSGGVNLGVGGASSAFGGAAQYNYITGSQLAVVANTGSGGAGGGASASNISWPPGGGGGAGGYVDAIITNPASTYLYGVGAAGAGGTAGASPGFAGSAGAAGIIIIEEFYQ